MNAEVTTALLDPDTRAICIRYRPPFTARDKQGNTVLEVRALASNLGPPEQYIFPQPQPTK